MFFTEKLFFSAQNVVYIHLLERRVLIAQKSISIEKVSFSFFYSLDGKKGKFNLILT